MPAYFDTLVKSSRGQIGATIPGPVPAGEWKIPEAMWRIILHCWTRGIKKWDDVDQSSGASESEVHHIYRERWTRLAVGDERIALRLFKEACFRKPISCSVLQKLIACFTSPCQLRSYVIFDLMWHDLYWSPPEIEASITKPACDYFVFRSSGFETWHDRRYQTRA